MYVNKEIMMTKSKKSYWKILYLFLSTLMKIVSILHFGIS